jgi:hypothetical protein
MIVKKLISSTNQVAPMVFMLGKLFARTPSGGLISLLVSLAFFLSPTPSCALDLTLQWQANTESDLAGYRFYYALESRHPSNPAPYDPDCQDYVGVEYSIDGGNTWVLIACPPPIVVDSGVTEIMVRGLAGDKAHFFAVSAYDTEGDGLESDFSNEEATLCISCPEAGLYVNADNDSSYTVHGRANAGAEVELFSGATSLGTTNADQNRAWSMNVDFEQRFSEGAVPLEVTSENITAPVVTAIYDMTKPESSASNNIQSFNGSLSIPWTASDQKAGIETSGVKSTELWHKPPGADWDETGKTQSGTGGTFYYTCINGDGTYYFATRSVDKAGNWEDEPNGDGDISIQYPVPSGGMAGVNAGGGCFISTAAADTFQPLLD